MHVLCTITAKKWVPTPGMFVTWICTVRGWAVLQSLMMCTEYGIACWILRRVVFPILAKLFQNIIMYNVRALSLIHI